METRVGELSDIPNPCFILRHPHLQQSRMIAEGVLVFSTEEKAAEHVRNFIQDGSTRITSCHVDDLRSSYTSVVVDYVSHDTDKLVVDISDGTGETQVVVGF